MSKFTPPKKWPTVSLGDLTASTRPICYGVLKPGQEARDGIPLVRVTDISSNYFDSSQLLRIAPELDEEFRRSRLNGGEILISIQGTIGRVAICPPEFAGANISRTIAVVQPDDRVNVRFAYWFLRFLGATDGFPTVGSTRSSLNIEALRLTTVPLPPLPEQRRIAAILDQADALRAKRREALAELDQLTQSIFIEMFGDPLLNPMGWPMQSLRKLGKVKTGGTPPSSKEGMFNGDIPFVTPGDLSSNLPAKRTVTEEGAAEAEIVRTGAALVCCIGATIGKMDKAKSPSAFNQQINAVEWNEEVDDDYGITVLSFFKSRIASWGASTTLPILKKSSFEKIEIPVPTVALQKKFAQRVLAVEKFRTRCVSFQEESESLFSSLQHRAFRGEL